MIKKNTRISTHMTSRVMKLIKLVKHFHLTRYSKCIVYYILPNQQFAWF